jgi:decaprenylphospho-beta-D-ribofuranose 2-oxidase
MAQARCAAAEGSDGALVFSAGSGVEAEGVGMAGRVLLSRWGGGTGTAARLVTPSTDRGAQTIVAERPPRGLIARGGGCSYGDGSLNGGGTVLSTVRLNAVHRFDPDRHEIEVSGGARLGDVLRAMLPEGLALGAVPGTGHVTVGGAIAADVHGKDHPAVGSFGAWVASITLATPACGTIDLTPSGDRQELFWATVGGLGLTGVILRATLRLRPLPSAHAAVRTLRAASLDSVLAHLGRAGGEPLRVAFIDGTARGRRLGRGVVVVAQHADRPASRLRGQEWALPDHAWKPARRWPLGDLHLRRRPVARSVNAVCYHAARRRPGQVVVPLTRVWHPLDRIAGWDRLYGPRGFVQYQFVVPPGAEQVLAIVLETLTRAGCPALSGTIKLLGEGSGGLMSFPLPGWTLALDLPVGPPGLGRVLDRLDELVVGAKGRVYLAKDARLRRDKVAPMYPGLARFRRLCETVDPAGDMVSDLARRLGLRVPLQGTSP